MSRRAGSRVLLRITMLAIVPTRPPGEWVSGGAAHMEVPPGLDQDSASGLYKNSLARIGQAGRLHGAFIHGNLGIAARGDRNGEPGASHGNRRGRAVHAIRIGPAAIVLVGRGACKVRLWSRGVAGAWAETPYSPLCNLKVYLSMSAWLGAVTP